MYKLDLFLSSCIAALRDYNPRLRITSSNAILSTSERSNTLISLSLEFPPKYMGNTPLFPTLIDHAHSRGQYRVISESVLRISPGGCLRARGTREERCRGGGGREWNREREGRGSRTRMEEEEGQVEEEDLHDGITEATKRNAFSRAIVRSRLKL